MSLNGSCYVKGYLCLYFKDLNKLSDHLILVWNEGDNSSVEICYIFIPII